MVNLVNEQVFIKRDDMEASFIVYLKAEIRIYFQDEKPVIEWLNLFCV